MINVYAFTKLSNAFGQFYWSYDGPIAGKVCTQWYESSDIAGGWDNNYLCSDYDWDVQWSSLGPIPGMKCIQIRETAEPIRGWQDNYLCVPDRSPITFTFSTSGPGCGNDGVLRIYEPSDPHSWNDNYLCWSFDRIIYGLGCYEDRHARAFRTAPNVLPGNRYDLKSCESACSGFTYFALQNYWAVGSQCFCENDWSHATQYGTSTGCNKNGGGGPYANNIYTRSPTDCPVSPAAALDNDEIADDNKHEAESDSIVSGQTSTIFIIITSSAGLMVCCIFWILFAFIRRRKGNKEYNSQLQNDEVNNEDKEIETIEMSEDIDNERTNITGSDEKLPMNQ